MWKNARLPIDASVIETQSVAKHLHAAASKDDILHNAKWFIFDNNSIPYY